MKYGIDYDGTISDTSSMKSTWIKEQLGIEVSPWNTDRTSCVPLIGLENYEAMSKDVYGRDLTLRAPEVPGSLKGVIGLARKGDIYLITARLPQFVGHAKEWLASKGILNYFSGIETTIVADGLKRTKEQICKELNLDVLIDDDERHLVQIKLPLLRKILIKAGSSDKPELVNGIEYVRSWDEILKLIN